MAAFYKPYMSDDSDSETDSDGYTSEESLVNLPGKLPPVQTGMPANIGDNGNITNKGPKFETKESRNTTLLMINSRDRDTTLYPQPTYFTIRLPRPFKSVKTINITQLNLLNSFFNFSFSKGNTYMSVYEQGRTLNGGTQSNIVNVKIRDGTYGITDLVTELNSAMNATPLFADITVGNFINQFQQTGDYSILFNVPGAIVYNSLTQTYDANQTVSDIVARYFQTVQTVGTINFTYNQCLVAYYYPIVKEMIIVNNPTVPFITPTVAPPPGFLSWYDYLVFSFQGLDDPYVTQIVTNTTNQATFNTYRSANTFNSYLVNQYNCSYNSRQGRLVISAPSLNTSIQTDLTNQYNYYLNSLATQNGFTDVTSFQSQYATISYSNSVAIEFYNFIQSQFTSNFAVNFGQYTANFYSHSNNEVKIYNTLNRYGWDTSLSPLVSETTIDSNAVPVQVSTLWPNILLNKTTVAASTFISTLASPAIAPELSFGGAGESQLGYTDIVFTQNPTTYNRVAFTSRCRQNISIMALPRYLDNRSTSTDMVYNLGSTATQTPLLYDTHSPGNTYILTDISGNANFNMYTIEQNMFQTADYMRTYDQWLNYMTPQVLAGIRVQPADPNYNSRPPPADITLTSYKPYIFLQVNAASYPVEPNARFNIALYIEMQDGSAFPVSLEAVWYKDRAGFMADVRLDLAGTLGNESPRHYFQKDTTSFNAGTTGNTMVVTVNNFQTTYFMIHAQSITGLPASMPLRVFALLDGTYGDYTIATLEDRYDMPYSTLLSSLEKQYNPYSPVFQDPTLSIYNSNVFRLGYDLSGVSNNLLDYIIQTQTFNYDPENISDYINGTSNGLQYYFALSNNGAKQPPPTLSNSWSLYFGSNSSNTVFDSYNVGTPYTFGPIAMSESLLVNWFVPGASNEPKERFLYPAINADYSTKISTSSVFLPCINTPNLETDSSPPVFDDISGFCGMSFFLPPSQVVKLDSFLIKLAYTQPSEDTLGIGFGRENPPLPLSNIEFNDALYHNQVTKINTLSSISDEWDDWFLYNRRNTKIGIFNSSHINAVDSSDIKLSNAICTFTLEKITQVNNYTSQLGTLRTREPDWGTYYKYSIDTEGSSVWDVSTVTWTNTSQQYWRSTIVDPDIAPTYYAGNSNYPGYFLTPAQIYNYTYLPRTYGIAPSVGVATYDPTLGTIYEADIPNSFAIVPFFNDPATGEWRVGSFYGVSYTNQPALPSTGLAGAAPYSGPPGGYGWMIQPDSTIQMVTSVNSLFYWNMKVQYETVDLKYDPATDLTLFGGYPGIQNEYQDTMLFFYRNNTVNQDYGDVSTVTTNGIITRNYWTWGQESNTRYHSYDDQSGYNLLSYIYNEPVRPTIPEYAVHLRAYDPIPKFTTGLRFIGKNFTDFGTPTLGEIAKEISSLAGYVPVTDALAGVYVNNLYSTMTNGLPSYGDYASTISTNNAVRFNNGNFFSHEYADALIKFDSGFSTSVIFGQRVGYTGIQYTFTGYADCLDQYTNLYSTTQAALVVYTTVLSTASGQLNQYVIQNYSNILPPSVYNRNRITDPLPFQLLLSTPLVEPYKSQYDQWGLGYNLGFNKRDTPPAVSVTSDTFIRIVQDYVYLQLNPEFNVNSMAVSGKEDRAICLDSSAEEAKYFSKIILNDFGSYCRTAVQMPKQFNPVLGKYETLSCQLVDRNGNNISSVDCEYDFVLEMTELTTVPVDTASLLTTTADLELYASQK